MAYIDIDIEEHLDEVDTEYLIEELKVRAKRKSTTLVDYIIGDKDKDNDTTPRSNREALALHLGLNIYASDDDIMNTVRMML